eukprot:s4180_g6.t1
MKFIGLPLQTVLLKVAYVQGVVVLLLGTFPEPHAWSLLDMQFHTLHVNDLVPACTCVVESDYSALPGPQEFRSFLLNSLAVSEVCRSIRYSMTVHVSSQEFMIVFFIFLHRALWIVPLSRPA